MSTNTLIVIGITAVAGLVGLATAGIYGINF